MAVDSQIGNRSSSAGRPVAAAGGSSPPAGGDRDRQLPSRPPFGDRQSLSSFSERSSGGRHRGAGKRYYLAAEVATRFQTVRHRHRRACGRVPGRALRARSAAVGRRSRWCAIWFALPGIVFARRLYGSQPGSKVAALLVGPAWGYALSSLGLLALWAVGTRHIALLMLAPVVGGLAVLPVRRLAGTLTLPRFTSGDAGACALVLLAVTLVVGLPYAHVGEELPEGRAYRAYFTADFVWEVAVVAELSKGDMPPRNPYYLNDDLHYYWLMHLLPAAQRRTFGGTPTADQILLVNAFWSALAFAAFWYFFVRHFVSSPWAAAIGCIFVLLGTSLKASIESGSIGAATSRSMRSGTRTSMRSRTGTTRG